METLDKDARYQWLESRIVSTLQPKRDAIQSLIENDENRLSVQEFLDNEDVTNLYIIYRSLTHLYAQNSPPGQSFDKGLLFIKAAIATKLTTENINTDVSCMEIFSEIVHYVDLVTRDVFMPLFTMNQSVPDTEKDRFLDLFHRIINQTAATHTLVSESVVLPLPAFNVLAEIAQTTPERQQTVLNVLETTVTNWSKQIKALLQEEIKISWAPLLSPDDKNSQQQQHLIKNEIQLWTSRINKLNNLLVQLDSPFVQDVLRNLARNKSPYIQSFVDMKENITRAVSHAERNLRFASTLTPWIYQINSTNSVEEIVKILPCFMHTVFLIWRHSFYYHQKDKFHHLLQLLSAELVLRAKRMIGKDIFSNPESTYAGLKDALSICAMFRGTYLDYKEKADALNSKYMIPEKKIDPSKMLIWHVHPYGEDDPYKDILSNNDEFAVLRKSSPWPPRNASCFQTLNALIERCNDVQELTSTIRQFNILSETAKIGGTLTKTMDTMVSEIQLKYKLALENFTQSVDDDVMDISHKSEKFEQAFFYLRTKLKQLEHELAWILKQCFQRSYTLYSKLNLIDVFRGAYEREAIQRELNTEEKWMIQNLFDEFEQVQKRL
ncbi:unnamed protein product [Didymodactylos carnosus]|uniref:Dynein heavy chain tail domain-containing protein n=1 Tax=Didymodactylos carnosus TaxID=1234261 RepID=A0A8S2F233_9BILA|nr:unnamed protein product [Didymodactylos carnosus]CAF4129596.1 unnamed protein product [Didymodactylos carnosus]